MDQSTTAWHHHISQNLPQIRKKQKQRDENNVIHDRHPSLRHTKESLTILLLGSLSTGKINFITRQTNNVFSGDTPDSSGGLCRHPSQPPPKRFDNPGSGRIRRPRALAQRIPRPRGYRQICYYLRHRRRAELEECRREMMGGCGALEWSERRWGGKGESFRDWM